MTWKVSVNNLRHSLAHASASLVPLQQMQADLVEDLRDRVTQPVMLRDAQGEGESIGEIPLEEYLQKKK
ncbi:hypothetical protein L873DRAFT_1824459 [Choiromyces venosus 120613-1]|uniref:Uncharacterized protein n=1 Tax=Choiromyces venosus 120613-1 TaxID=1336337 RepID=A0A3N4IRX5_9PEZI|nr:hypothetical protein L873DRAFT_1824459 [Choiromyces venosus 120613-1]